MFLTSARCFCFCCLAQQSSEVGEWEGKEEVTDGLVSEPEILAEVPQSYTAQGILHIL